MLCIRIPRWCQPLVQVIVIILVVAVAARWDPAAVPPLVLGVVLCAWILAREAGAVAAAR
jgi:hypothetical protein